MIWYRCWFIDNNEKGKRDIQECIKEALKNYQDKGDKIKSIEISKHNADKGFFLDGIAVKIKNTIARNLILLEYERQEIT